MITRLSVSSAGGAIRRTASGVRVAVALLCVVAVAPSGHAVVPGGAKILAHMATAQPAPTPFAVNYVETAPDAPSRLALRVIADGLGRARIDLQRLDIGETHTVRYGSVGSDRPAGAKPVDEAPLWLQWWMGRPPMEMAAGARVDLDITSLAHADGTILWVVGAGPRDADRPQLQIERDTGLLRRATAVGGTGENATVHPARLDDFIATERGFSRFPKRLTLTVDGRVVTFLNTWVRTGDAAKLDPRELAPPVVQ